MYVNYVKFNFWFRFNILQASSLCNAYGWDELSSWNTDSGWIFSGSLHRNFADPTGDTSLSAHTVSTSKRALVLRLTLSHPPDLLSSLTAWSILDKVLPTTILCLPYSRCCVMKLILNAGFLIHHSQHVLYRNKFILFYLLWVFFDTLSHCIAQATLKHAT